MLVLSRFAVPRRYHRAIGLGAVVTLTVVIAACADGNGGALSPSSIARAARADASKPPRDTTKPPRDTTKPPRDTTKPPRDTTKPPPRDTLDTLPALPEKVAVSGRVVGVVVAPTDSARDTLRFDAIAGAKIRIMRNILVNGRSAQELAAHLTTDTNGRFSVSLKGGYYVAYADPPAGSNWSSSYSYLAATQPQVTVDVYLWKRGGG